MTAGRVVAVLLTLVFVLVVLGVFVLVFRAAGHPGWGWLVGVLFLLVAGWGVVREQRRQR